MPRKKEYPPDEPMLSESLEEQIAPDNPYGSSKPLWIRSTYQLYRCSFTICSQCPLKEKCLSQANIKQRHGRTLERSEYEEAVEANRLRILNNREMYKRRQAIVEHPFGTIKRSWGAYYTLLKRKEKVSGEMAIVFTGYNLRRCMSILGIPALIRALEGALRRFSGLWRRGAAVRTVTALAMWSGGGWTLQLERKGRRAFFHSLRSTESKKKRNQTRRRKENRGRNQTSKRKPQTWKFTSFINQSCLFLPTLTGRKAASKLLNDEKSFHYLHQQCSISGLLIFFICLPIRK